MYNFSSRVQKEYVKIGYFMEKQYAQEDQFIKFPLKQNSHKEKHSQFVNYQGHPENIWVEI